MIAYGVCVGPSGLFGSVCRPALDRFRRPESPLFTVRGASSMFDAYNLMLEAAARERDCAAMVLLHDDVELRADPEAALLPLLADISVAVVGVIGGLRPTSLAWWRELDGRRGRILDHRKAHEHGRGTHEVDVADDPVLCVSRWAIEQLRFPPGRYRGFEGLGVIISTIARAAGKRVLVSELDLLHHNDCTGFNDVYDWRRNELRWQYDHFTLGPLERARNLLEDAAVPTLPPRMACRRLARRLAGRGGAVSDGESGDPVTDRYVERWIERSRALRGRMAI